MWLCWSSILVRGLVFTLVSYKNDIDIPYIQGVV